MRESVLYVDSRAWDDGCENELKLKVESVA